MVQVPAAIPETIPVDAPTVAIAGLLLLHVPPLAESVNVVEEPMHVCGVPPMPDNVPETVTV